MAIQFTNYKLFIDPVEQVVFKNYGDLTQIGTPVFTQGDKARVEIYVVQQSVVPGSPMGVLAFPSGTVNVQVGELGSAQVVNSSTSTAVSTPTISAGTVGGNLSPFTIGTGAQAGYFQVVIANASPALSATTRYIQYPIDTAVMEQAIEDAVNGQAGWSAADCQVLQTGETTGTISLVATQSATVRQISGVTSNITFTSGLTGLSGKYVDLDFSVAGVGTFLGSDTSKSAVLEVSVTDGSDTQTYIQLPCLVRKHVTT